MNQIDHRVAFRRWRVRHSYPTPVVELAVRLIPIHGVAAVCQMLDIPMSVAYRWRKKACPRSFTRENPGSEAETIAALAAQCTALGFSVAAPARASHPRVAATLATSAQRAPRNGLRTADLPGGSRQHDGNAGVGANARRLTLRTEDRSAMVASPRPRLSPADAAPAGGRYVFAACKERPARTVRPRMEAVRKAIDTGYFLEVDCRTLAVRAGMSLHHFIRVFRDMFGLSPHRYLMRARVNAAKRLLRFTTEPIDLIAIGVGFHSGPSLSRAFKRIEGSTVSSYCRTAKKGGPCARHHASIVGVGLQSSTSPAE